MSKHFKILFYFLVSLFSSHCLRLFDYKNQILESSQIKLNNQNDKGIIEVRENLSEENIEIKIEQKDNKEAIITGKYGVIYFVTNYNDTEKNIFNINDIEEKTSFNTSFFAQNNNYDVNCRLWKSITGQIRIFCKFKTLQEFQNETSYLEKSSFSYDKYTITIT